MTERERFDRIVRKRQPVHRAFFERAHRTRRCFFRDALTGLGGFFLLDTAMPAETDTEESVVTKDTAKSVIFLFLRGAPSHVDTFDFKNISGVTPSDLAPEQFGDVTLPTALLGNTSRVLDKIAIVRSGLSWARAHPLAQSWMQIGRNPTSATGRIAPHVGSVVALEKDTERTSTQVFPAFIALQPRNVVGSGYFPLTYAPFHVQPDAAGLGSAEHSPGKATFNRRWSLLESLEAGYRGDNKPFGDRVSAMGEMYQSARQMMFNDAVESAFTFTEEESTRYGGTSFGDSVLVARKIVEQDQGTRFIQVDHGGWDHHSDIYGTLDLNPNYTIYAQAAEFDPAFAALIEDLDTSGKLSETLVVVCGEFGRTPGSLSAEQQGRDHYLQMFYVFAGGGVTGGSVIGATNDSGGLGAGAFTTETGWSRERAIRPEDVEATIYSALGIDWTTTRTDDPLGRGFSYVPLTDDDVYAPINELWE